MGLLDDAIREHMELKRLRGADPDVVAQQEHDALGPVLREEAADQVEGGGEGVNDAAAPHAEGATPRDAQDTPQDAHAAPQDAHAAPQDAPENISARADPALLDDPLPREDGALHDGNDALLIDDSPEPQPSDHDPADPDFANLGQETAELDMRTVLDEQHETADRAGQIDSAGFARATRRVASYESREDGESVEDVLEETPDFLRDTPEQERLWFEQQPPRDFDFDK